MLRFPSVVMAEELTKEGFRRSAPGGQIISASVVPPVPAE